ncbi:MAG: hypothetical protein NVSMB1_19820 [Polyangiales bacterium]
MSTPTAAGMIAPWVGITALGLALAIAVAQGCRWRKVAEAVDSANVRAQAAKVRHSFPRSPPKAATHQGNRRDPDRSVQL